MKGVIDLISTKEIGAEMEGVDVSSLIRCTVQLLIKNMVHSSTSSEKDKCVESGLIMIKILKQGLDILMKAPDMMSVDDNMWIISKIYNCALHQTQENSIDISIKLSEQATTVSIENLSTTCFY